MFCIVNHHTAQGYTSVCVCVCNYILYFDSFVLIQHFNYFISLWRFECQPMYCILYGTDDLCSAKKRKEKRTVIYSIQNHKIMIVIHVCIWAMMVDTNECVLIYLYNINTYHLINATKIH